MRVPAIVRWPNFIPADSVSDELCTLMDLHPTFAKLAGAQLPERKRDGQNIWPVWSPVMPSRCTIIFSTTTHLSPSRPRSPLEARTR